MAYKILRGKIGLKNYKNLDFVSAWGSNRENGRFGGRPVIATP
jgi:hypothetical protein